MHNALAKGVRLARPVEAVSLAGTHLSVLLNEAATRQNSKI